MDERGWSTFHGWGGGLSWMERGGSAFLSANDISYTATIVRNFGRKKGTILAKIP